MNKFPKGQLLDVGCRDRKQANFIGIDSRNHPGVDIVHDLEKFPYPIESDSCHTIKCAHVIEHIKPWNVIPFMDEMWRMLMVGGQMAISAPYARSQGYMADPTHCTMITEKTWMYFDQDSPIYEHYRPKPWKSDYIAYKPDGNIEAVLVKRAEVDETNLVTKAMMLGAIQKPTELQFFLEFMKDRKMTTIVEIGTARGGVFYALCKIGGDKAKVISIDMPGGEFGGGYVETDIETFKTFGKDGQQLSFIRKDSHKKGTLDELKKILGEDGIDLLFIDGDHSYKGVRLDYEMYSPLMSRGGIIAFHDVCFHPYFPTCEVNKLWDEIKKNYKYFEFIDPKDKTWGGIGVLEIEKSKKK
jgi:predicted O-methyltransferase YrrM